MANNRQIKKALADIETFFVKKGKVLTITEYVDAEDKPVPFSSVRRIFRSYSRMVDTLVKNHPELLEMATKKPEPKVAPKVKVQEPKAAVTPKAPVEPKAAVKPTTVVSKDK